MSNSDYYKLARLFLLELDTPTLDALRSDERFCSVLPLDVQEARVEFTRLFTMSVYPYASVFSENSAVLNGESTADVERFYERVGFETRREWMLGAPDALGAELECLALMLERGEESRAREFLSRYVLPWAPVCCLAVERNARLEIYRAAARATRDLLLAEGEAIDDFRKQENVGALADPQERDLHWVVDHLTAPARCGLFLSKDDLHGIADAVQVPTGFGERGLMLVNLLRGAGVQERVPVTLGALQISVRSWMNAYEGWVANYPRSSGVWRTWLARTQATDSMLSEMAADAQDLDSST